jgi:hypothetical protein
MAEIEIKMKFGPEIFFDKKLNRLKEFFRFEK